MDHALGRSLVILAVVARAAVAGAQAAPEKVGEVAVQVEENTTDFGRLHLSAALLGYQLSSPDGGPVSTLGAFFELHGRLVLQAHATLPLLGVIAGDTPPYRLEGGAMLFVKDKLEAENEEVIVGQTLPTGDSPGVKTFTTLPMVNRNRGGLGVSIMLAHGSEKVEAGGMSFTTDSTALIGVVGIAAIGSTGYRVTVEGYGKRSNYRWNAGGLDALVDLSRTYDIEPDEAGARYGGRLWAETLWFRRLGMSARVEIGKYPAQAGWILLASLGGSLHL